MSSGMNSLFYHNLIPYMPYGKHIKHFIWFYGGPKMYEKSTSKKEKKYGGRGCVVCTPPPPHNELEG